MKKILPFLLPVVFLTLAAKTCVPDKRSAVSGVTPILLVQGESHRSPLVDQTVTIEGTVTAVRNERRVNGFWLEDPWAGDRDSPTPRSWVDASDDRMMASSGIFVLTEGEATVAPGDSVRVTGKVIEYERPGSLGITEIEAVTVGPAASSRLRPEPVRIGPSGRRIPEMIDDDGMIRYEPDDDAIDFWESLEGMIIEVGRAEVVGPTTRFGDFVVVPVGEAADARRTARGGVLLVHDERFPRNTDENTERIIVDQSLLEERRQLAVGDVVTSPLIGVIHYDFGNYRLLLTEPIVVAPVGARAVELPDLQPSTLTVASYNVLNLSAADPERRFEQVGRSIVRDLGSPDIVGLQEVQDDNGERDDGTVSAAETLRRLVEEIVDQGGPRYVWRQIDPLDNADGGAPGSNIRVAYLVNPDRVEAVDRGEGGASAEVSIAGSGDDVHLSFSPGRIGTTNECFLGEGASDESEGTRKSLALEVRFRGETYFLVNNHLKSKRGDDAVFGSVQPPVRHTEVKRKCQAEVIASVVSGILRRDADANLIVLGDMNDHEFREPMVPFLDAGLVSMVSRVPESSRYSYNYLGNSQILDHVFVSPGLAGDSELIIIHVNTDFPDSEAASDHDPLLLTISTD